MDTAARAAAVAKVSGRPWDHWVTELDARGAERLPHAEIAKLAFELMPESVESRGWWAQGAAIAYGQQKGLRVAGQSSSGDFQVAASRSLAADKDGALAAWRELAEGMTEHDGVPVEGEATTSSTEKWRYWRLALADGTKVSVNVSDKGTGKAAVAVNHTKLESADDVERWRAYWKALLKQL
ncbi:hypothetical protein [Bogoriella caseilytica]|uniref:Uncharacterized protein n=1 Tax=Bogoriella caseilytica TaxID=56055 RepID=A0A3N2BBW5_9MICO|nr:hypothetical protein [Bogoriella caseilytica]ROR72746.1 hypothetical protein EDD31_1105 [Bogoriella caseilytica]